MIRLGNVADLEAIAENNITMAQETEALQLDPEIVRRGVRALLEGDEPGRYWVVEEDGAIVGQIMVTYEWSDWRNARVWWIQSVYVAPSARGRGVYRALYEHVVDAAKKAGAVGLRLYVDRENTKAQEVYRRLGMNGDHYLLFEAMFD